MSSIFRKQNSKESSKSQGRKKFKLKVFRDINKSQRGIGPIRVSQLNLAALNSAPKNHISPEFMSTRRLAKIKDKEFKNFRRATHSLSNLFQKKNQPNDPQARDDRSKKKKKSKKLKFYSKDLSQDSDRNSSEELSELKERIKHMEAEYELIAEKYHRALEELERVKIRHSIENVKNRVAQAQGGYSSNRSDYVRLKTQNQNKMARSPDSGQNSERSARKKINPFFPATYSFSGSSLETITQGTAKLKGKNEVSQRLNVYGNTLNTSRSRPQMSVENLSNSVIKPSKSILTLDAFQLHSKTLENLESQAKDDLAEELKRLRRYRKFHAKISTLMSDLIESTGNLSGRNDQNDDEPANGQRMLSLKRIWKFIKSLVFEFIKTKKELNQSQVRSRNASKELVKKQKILGGGQTNQRIGQNSNSRRPKGSNQSHNLRSIWSHMSEFSGRRPNHIPVTLLGKTSQNSEAHGPVQGLQDIPLKYDENRSKRHR